MGEYGDKAITLAALAARVTTALATGDSFSVAPFKRFIAVCQFTNKDTDAGDTCDVYVDFSPDNGTTWLNGVHFTQALGNGAAATEFAVLEAVSPGVAVVDATADAASGAVRPTLFGGLVRARWVIVNVGGADASFTFSVKLYCQS